MRVPRVDRAAWVDAARTRFRARIAVAAGASASLLLAGGVVLSITGALDRWCSSSAFACSIATNIWFAVTVASCGTWLVLGRVRSRAIERYAERARKRPHRLLD